ncbi:MAG: protein translocase subunit SecF [Clostridiaceae bacterium]
MLKIVEKTKIWFAISSIVIIVGLGFMFTRGLNFGIDFSGGTIIAVDMGSEFDKTKADDIVKTYDVNAVTTVAGGTEYDIKSNVITSDNYDQVFDELKTEFNLEDTALLSAESTGASIGSETKVKALIAIGVATLLMLLYIGIRFEFKFGLAAILALLHDVLITLAVYAIFYIPVNASFVAAMLTIIGYSINDTIVVFDRIRENVKKMRKSEISEVTNKSITQTITRSVFTVVTTLFTILSVLILVPSVRDFSLPLTIGIVSGCYSSIFIASPFWVILKNKKGKTA